MNTLQTTMISKSAVALIIIYTIALLPASSGGLPCPVECVCSPDAIDQDNEQTNGQLLKITCQWPHIPGANLFSTFPHRLVYSLIIQCETTFPRSRYVSSMFASFVTLRHLTIRNCHSEDSSLPNGLLQGLTKLKTLHLEAVSVPGLKIHLSMGALVGAPYMERLTLSHSMLGDIPGNLLCHFKDLKVLNLSHNDIRDIKSIGYGGNGECENHLIILDLTNNQISRLDGAALRKTNSLHILRLLNNAIRAIEKGTFAGLNRLQELYLSHNNLTTIEDIPPSIQILDLAGNKLRSIPAMLRSHQNLVHLNISGNLLADDGVPSPVFRLADQLTVLDASGNMLKRIGQNTFQNASGLQQLYLSENRLAEVDADAFKSVPRLRYLDLSINRLQSLRKEHLNGLQNLSELILDKNNVSSIADDAFASTPQLRQLSISTNAISHAPTALTMLYYLQRLDLSGNRINAIPKFLFDKLPNLKELRLSSNQIRSVERYVFEKIPSLTLLDLSYNRIEHLATNCFEGTTAVKLLRLDGNYISDIRGNFVGLPQLQALNLSSNRIAYIDFAMLPISLRSLYAANNSITHVSNVLRQQRRPSQLIVLDLSRNKIKQLNADALPNSIEIANFSANNIARLEDHTILEKQNLSFLDLSFNWLEELRLEAVKIKGAGRMTQISLTGNPLRCTCHNEWIRVDRDQRRDQISIPRVIDIQRLTCTLPRSGDEPIPVNEVPVSQFLCEYEILCTDDCMCCDFDSCDCKSVCPDGCTCFHDSEYRSNVIQCDSKFQATSINVRRRIPMRATEIDLSRNRIDDLQGNSFFARFRLKRLFLNDTNIGTIAANAFNGLTSLETLDLSFNRLDEIRGDEFNNLPKLHRLLLNDNQLQSISELIFERLSGLRELTLHNNRFVALPNSIVNYSPTLASLSLSGNPWKCDCDPNRYVIQRWLPENTVLIPDHRTIYCADSILTEGRTISALNYSNSTTALSSLPVLAVGQTVIKVNFWTFVNGINTTFCRPPSQSDSSDTVASAAGNTTIRSSVEQAQDNLTLMFICVAIAAVALILVITVIVWRCHNFLRCKYSKYATAGGASSVNSSTRTTATTPIPLLQFDAFVSYSAEEEEFVTSQITNRLEQEYPYYSLCLLYRDLPTSPCIERHRIDDKIITNMERSQRVITVLTRNFLEQEWKSTQLRTAYQYLMREKQRKPIIVIVVDELPEEIDPTLAHYLRINRCIYWNDPMFWQKFTEAMPERSVQQESTLSNSSHYSDVYGAIVPSRFV